MSLAMREKLLALLDGRGAAYRLVEHEAATSADHVTRLVKLTPHQGAKSLLLTVEGAAQPYVLAVLPGDARIDYKELRRLLNSHNVRMADPDAVMRVTDCEIGSVPPFGELCGVPTLVDEELFSNDEVGFSPAVRDASVLMGGAEFRRILTAATIARFSKPSEGK